MPLSERVEFKAILQRENRIQIPKIVRWKFKLEPDQAMKVTIAPVHTLICGFAGGEAFYAHMSNDGRITLPLLIRALLHNSRNQQPITAGALLQVRLDPT